MIIERPKIWRSWRNRKEEKEEVEDDSGGLKT